MDPDVWRCWAGACRRTGTVRGRAGGFPAARRWWRGPGEVTGWLSHTGTRRRRRAPEELPHTRPLPSPLAGRWAAQGEGQGPDGSGVMAGPASLSPAAGARGTRGGGRAIRCWHEPDFAQRPSATVLGSVPSLLPGPSCLLLPLPGPSPAPFHQALFRFFFFSGRSQNSCGFTNDTPCPLPSACPPAQRAARALREPAGSGCFRQVPASVSPPGQQGNGSGLLQQAHRVLLGAGI